MEKPTAEDFKGSSIIAVCKEFGLKVEMVSSGLDLDAKIDDADEPRGTIRLLTDGKLVFVYPDWPGGYAFLHCICKDAELLFGGKAAQ